MREAFHAALHRAEVAGVPLRGVVGMVYRALRRPTPTRRPRRSERRWSAPRRG